MKTLFITNTYLTGNNGGIYATKAYINAFAALSESMTLVYAMKEGAEPMDIQDERITLIPVWDSRSKVEKYLDLCLGTVNRFQKCIFNLIDTWDYDVVVFNNSVSSSGIIKKIRRRGLKTITIHHNYQIEYLRGDCDFITLLPQLFWTYIYERASVRNSNLNLTITNEDIDLLRNKYGNTLFECLGIFEFKDISLCRSEYPHEKRGHNYVITGWLGSKQTEISLIPWIKIYFPLLKEIDAEAKLTISGRSPSASLCRLAEKYGIKIIASPIDMQPILDQADYYICPTDRGGGLKLRNMDGLKSGLPVLTHEISARGYDYMLNKGIVYSYNSPESFKNELKRMLSCKISKNEILYEYKKYYSLSSGIYRLSQLLKK